jgi:hypothetical protein
MVSAFIAVEDFGHSGAGKTLREPRQRLRHVTSDG